MGGLLAHRVERKRRWQVYPPGTRGILLGFVEAPDLKAAEATAMRAFALNEYQRSRLLLRERM